MMGGSAVEESKSKGVEESTVLVLTAVLHDTAKLDVRKETLGMCLRSSTMIYGGDDFAT